MYKTSPKDIILKTFKIRREQDQSLEFYAFDLNASKSDLVRQCIDKALPLIYDEAVLESAAAVSEEKPNMSKQKKPDTIKLLRYAMAVVEMDTPGKRSLLMHECQKFDIDMEALLKEVDSMVREYDYQLTRPTPKGLLKG